MAYNSSHTGTQIDDAIDKTQLMPELKGERTAYANLPVSPTTGDVYLVTTATTGFDAGFYRYSGSAWVYMGNPRQDADDIDDHQEADNSHRGYSTNKRGGFERFPEIAQIRWYGKG